MNKMPGEPLFQSVYNSGEKKKTKKERATLHEIGQLPQMTDLYSSNSICTMDHLKGLSHEIDFKILIKIYRTWLN
jgi:hypothetical protein